MPAGFISSKVVPLHGFTKYCKPEHPHPRSRGLGRAKESHCFLTLRLSGLIFSGVLAQRPYHVRLLGYFEPSSYNPCILIQTIALGHNFAICAVELG